MNLLEAIIFIYLSRKYNSTEVINNQNELRHEPQRKPCQNQSERVFLFKEVYFVLHLKTSTTIYYYYNEEGLFIFSYFHLNTNLLL